MKKHSGIHPKGEQTASTTGGREPRGMHQRSLSGTTEGRYWKALLLLGSLLAGSLTFRLDMELPGARRASLALALGLSMEGRRPTRPESPR